MNRSSLHIADPRLASSVEQIRQYASRVMRDLIEKYFTDHGETHLTRIILVADRILEVNNKRDFLSDEERYVFTAAAYLHDIGMQAEYFEPDSGLRRSTHHSIGRRVVLDNWSAIGLEQEYVQIVALVAEGHRGQLDERYRDTILGNGKKIRTKLLAGLLFVSDELDISCERVVLDRFKLLDPPPESVLHFYKHYYTRGVEIADTRCIHIRFAYPSQRRLQYQKIFGDSVVSKVKSTLAEGSNYLMDDYAITLALRDSDIAFEEDATLESVQPLLYERVITAHLGLRDFFRINEIAFQSFSGGSDAEKFYAGYSDWTAVVNNLDIVRSQYPDLRKQLTLTFERATQTQSITLFLIEGEAGSGKTTVLFRLAYDLYSSGEMSDLNLLWFPVGSHFDIEQLRRVYYTNQKPVIVFVDSMCIGSFIEACDRASSGVKDKSAPVVAVVTTRSNEWRSSGGDRLQFNYSNRITLSTLTDPEIKSLIQKLDENQQLHTLAPLSPAERFSSFKYRAGGQLLVAMLEATRGKGFSEIILDEYRQLAKSHAHAAIAYEYVCLFFQYDVLIPRGLLVLLTHCSDED